MISTYKWQKKKKKLSEQKYNNFSFSSLFYLSSRKVTKGSKKVHGVDGVDGFER